MAAELAAAVEALTDSAGWRSMLEVSARFRRYSLNNQLLLWAQATQRGMTLTRVAAFGTWRKLGYRVRAGEKGLRIFGPVTRRLRADEVASWLAQGRDPFDPDGRPRLVVRGFTVEYVFDLSQVDPGPDAQPLPDTRPWIAQRGDGPAGLWPALVALTEAHGFTLDVRPARSEDGGAHGWTDYATRTVWVNSDCDEAERVRILAHETAGHIRCDHEHRRDISAGSGRPRPTASPTWCSPRWAWTSAPRRWSTWPTGAAATPTCFGPPPRPCTGWPPRSSPTSTRPIRARPQPEHGYAYGPGRRGQQPVPTASNSVATRRGRSFPLRPLLVLSFGSVGGLEGVHHGLGDPAAVGDLVAVLPGPGPDRRGLLPVQRLRPPARARGHLRCPAPGRRAGSAALAARRDKRRQRVAQPGGVVLGQVNLIGPAVDVRTTTVPAASDPSRSSTNFTFTCCAMPASVSVVPCCATSDYAYSDQDRQTRHLKWPRNAGE